MGRRVSVLGEDQDLACRQLASKDGDRFAGLDLQEAPQGAILINGAATWMERRIAEEVPAVATTSCCSRFWSWPPYPRSRRSSSTDPASANWSWRPNGRRGNRRAKPVEPGHKAPALREHGSAGQVARGPGARAGVRAGQAGGPSGVASNRESIGREFVLGQRGRYTSARWSTLTTSTMSWSSSMR